MSRRKGSESFGELADKFCNSSTVHGTFFWKESPNWPLKIVWFIIVGAGKKLSLLFLVP
jgi:hypothetical protein